MIMMSVRDICSKEQVELRGEKEQPYHCGEKMEIRSGLFGPDYVKCAVCDLEIGNMKSPHVNGGYMVDSAWAEEHGDKTWVKID